MADLATSAALFEVSLPEYKQLKTCRRELRLLKELWDMVTLVRAVVQEPGHSAQRCFQARAGQQAALGWHGRLARAPATGTWRQLGVASQRCRAVAASQRAHCHQREDETWGRLLHLEQVCMVCAVWGARWAHRVCGHWVCCSSSWAGTLLLITCCENVSWVQVNLSIATWNTTRWSDLNVEDMDIECKKFAKDIRSLDKEVKSWDAFTGLESSMKNMMTSLRAVSELQNPAIRDRHWQELVQTTKVLPSPPAHPWPRRLQSLAQEAPKIHIQQGKGAIRFKSGHMQIFV